MSRCNSHPGTVCAHWNEMKSTTRPPQSPWKHAPWTLKYTLEGEQSADVCIVTFNTDCPNKWGYRSLCHDACQLISGPKMLQCAWDWCFSGHWLSCSLKQQHTRVLLENVCVCVCFFNAWLGRLSLWSNSEIVSITTEVICQLRTHKYTTCTAWFFKWIHLPGPFHSAAAVVVDAAFPCKSHYGEKEKLEGSI